MWIYTCYHFRSELWVPKANFHMWWFINLSATGNFHLAQRAWEIPCNPSEDQTTFLTINLQISWSFFTWEFFYMRVKGWIESSLKSYRAIIWAFFGSKRMLGSIEIDDSCVSYSSENWVCFNSLIVLVENTNEIKFRWFNVWFRLIWHNSMYQMYL